MQATILILDAISTNRIMLKVQLSAAWYHVVQSDRLEGLIPLIRRCRPDLIVTSMDLPDGDAIELVAQLRASDVGAGIPVIAITPQNHARARLRALAAGVEDVLSQPVDDLMLQARIRCLLRARSNRDELHLTGPQGARAGLAEQGLAEQAAAFGNAQVAAAPLPPLQPANVALLTPEGRTGAQWRIRLARTCPHHIRSLQMSEANLLMRSPVPDAIVVALTRGDDAGLRLLADLRARAATRNAVVIALVDPADSALAAEALDRGAHDVVANGFCAEELSLRLDSQLRIRDRSERMRNDLRDGLKAAMRDPMTGLYNRRYALPKLAGIVRAAAETKATFAVMLADLDHFKAINDHYGHLTGDAVLTEAATRLQAVLRPSDLIARVGGEEFLIVLPATNPTEAAQSADDLCRRMNGTPFIVPGAPGPISVTVSIGVALGPLSARTIVDRPDDAIALMLFDQADRALYDAKHAGRNQVTMLSAAA